MDNCYIYQLFISISRIDDKYMKINTGLNLEQFNHLLDSLPSLLLFYKNVGNNASQALYTYLMKLRTGRSNDEIAAYFKVTRTTVSRRIVAAREALTSDFMPNHLRYRNREEMLQSKTDIADILYTQNKPNSVVLIWDGTYIYVQKSANMKFQKETYTDQKKRNFVKPMVCVSTDGFIEMVYGLYPATMNDATILNSIIQSNDEINNILQDDDVMLLDRGFRDSEQILVERGLDVKMPAFTKSKNKNAVLTTTEANESRKVTKQRFPVETRNGHFKSIWKIFSQVWRTEDLKHLMDDLRICAAFINHFFARIICNKNNAEEIGSKMLAQMEKPNRLRAIVEKNSFQKAIRQFEEFDFTHFPKLSLEDLELVGLGTYILRIAKSYYFHHLKSNNNLFNVFKCPDDIFRQYFSEFLGTAELILVKMNSRFQSTKSYYTFVLFDPAATGPNAVLEYYCDCKCGSRTVGTCAHIICVTWYLGWGQHQPTIKEPAEFANNILILRHQHLQEQNIHIS